MRSNNQDIVFQTLINRALANDSAAFGELYTRYLTPLFRYIVVQSKDSALAQDIVQTAFVKAWRAIESGNIQQDTTKSWLYTIARNTLLDHYKTSHETAWPVDEEGDPMDVEDTKDKPHTKAELGEEKSKIRKALLLLTPDQREVITHRFLNDLSVDETSEIMRKKPDAIRQLQHRALQSLKEKYG